MDFNPPDPEKIQQSIFRLKDAFQRAADADTGSSQPAFQKLNDKFNDLVELQDSLDLEGLAGGGSPDFAKLAETAMKAISTISGFQKAMNEVRGEAQSNPSAAIAWEELQETLKEEGKELSGGMSFPGGGFPGGGFPGFPGGRNDDQGPANDDDVDQTPKAPKPPKPKKPGNGGFKL